MKTNEQYKTNKEKKNKQGLRESKMATETHHSIRVEGMGEVNVFVQGDLDPKRVFVVTVH